MDLRAVQELRSLARRDAVLSTAIRRVEEQEAVVAHTRARSDAIAQFFATLPEQESRLRSEIENSEDSLARRRDEVTELQRVLDLAQSEDERERTEKAIARGRDHVSAAEVRLGRARSALKELQEDAAEFPTELERLEVGASALCAEDSSLPAVEGGLDALSEWASRAHSVLFLALSQLTTERDRVIREADELASMLLGEETYGSTITQTLRRIEERSARSDAATT
jgi:chromosome segregation ATPase